MRTCHRTIAILLLVALAACSPAAPAAAPTPAPAPTVAAPTTAAFPVTIVDDSQAQVTIKAAPQRIISLAPSHTEALFALGLEGRVAGVTQFCDYPAQAAQKDKVGGFADIDLEKVVNLNPDLVLATSLHALKIVPALRERGLTVVVGDPQTVEDALANIVTIGRLTGRGPEAEALVKQVRGRLDAVAAKVARAARPRVYWELTADMFSAGAGSFVDDLITLAGGDNVGRRLSGPWPKFTLEALVAADPEVVVLANHGFGETIATVKGRAGWAGMTAVKQGRIVEVQDVNIVSRPGPRIADGVEYIARALHPELFK